MPTTLPPAFWMFWAAAFGLVVGSFLNVAIHRLPREGESIGHPKRSRCPRCKRTLTWRENIPVVSWALQRGRCRGCAQPIPWRYPLVELLTGALWVLALWMAPPDAWALVLVWCLVLSGLVVATFVDFDFFEIPDEISIGGMLLAPLCSLLVPALHADTWLAQELAGPGEGALAAVPGRVDALIGSLAGIAVGGGVLVAIGYFGSKAFGRDAMGFGDVKLLAAGGGFVGPGGALAALLIGAVVASFVGLANFGRFTCFLQRRHRARGAPQPLGASMRAARIAARYLPFGPYLGIGIGIALVDWDDVARLLDLLLSPA